MKKLSELRESTREAGFVSEALRPEYVQKIKQLIKLGLINSDKGQLLIRALGRSDVTELTVSEKEVIFHAFETLLNHVVDDRQTFQRLKQTMKEDNLDESDDVSKEHGYEPGSYRDLVHAKLNTKGYKKVHDDEYVHPVTRKRLSLVVRDNKVWKTMSTPIHEETDEFQKFAFPSIILLRRKAIRLFPDGKKVGMYYADKLKRHFAIPSTGEAVSEETDIAEAVSNPFPASPGGEHSTPVMSALKGICANKEPAQVQFRNGSKLKVDILTAHAILTVYGRLSNPENQVRFDKLLNRDNEGFMKIVAFVHKHYTSSGQ